MVSKFKRAAAVGAVAALGLSLAACGGGGDDNKSSNGGASGGTSGSTAEGTAGGTLTVLSPQPYESADPARIYYGVQIAHFRRTLYRGLVGFPLSTDSEVGNTPVPDLATDTGTSEEGGKVWKFTLKDGVKWEDGSDITCADVAYGTSRPFANDTIIGGPNYMLSYLDIPTNADGSSKYKGPYTKEGQDLFDKAVTCDGKTITFKFNKPWADFPLAIASLMMADPYKQSVDQGAKSTWKVLASGPYKLKGGTWDKNSGGTLVRNDQYDAATDSPDLRKALPDQIDYKVDPSDTASELINDRLMVDAPADQSSISTARVQASQFAKLTGPVEQRHVNVESPYTSYLVPNFKQPNMKNEKVRQALAVSLNLDGYVKALGGNLAASNGESIVSPGVPGYQPNPNLPNPGAGDPAAAKKLLEESGVKMPVAIKVGYVKTPTADNAFGVLKENWEKAGFKVDLSPLTDTYYDVIAKPDDNYDVTWAGWGADWPSMMTVLPPLFDSRPNFSANTCGQDYGCYQSKEFEALVDQAANAASVDDQIKFMQEGDALLGKDVAYIPLEVTKFNWLYGSKVTGFVTTPMSNAYPDLGQIGVQH